MISLYDISIPVITNVLNTLSSILHKGGQYAKEHNISDTDLLGSRIYEDMFPLSTQTIIIAQVAKKTIERLSDVTLDTIPKLDHEVKSLEDLYNMIDGTLQELGAVDRASIEGKDNEDIVFNIGPHMMKKTTRTAYVLGYATPYVFFHLDITYAILRNQGVPLRKLHYVTEFIKDMPDA
ncbi:hypothetical protein BKA67DRAFT_569226 [Truncatella angustata]|uniref:Uncharacterized protein n=1 Tax=Truncatella angustata TaxID=152316 RepID=A0A9P8UJP2_9PEZI|nr:uncharacterized protein BKA67DRAFT_569226 [Truncatella angustata]KAH6653339.1 hypothetical protein BKA67DRAFT_569226 [Truncatella angustata]KAH8196388.1 hypothetical protein TruAng_009438 [Truncatella angustata]